MKHEMNLNDKYFNKIKEGYKKVEVRLCDVKRKSLSIGDIITFNNRLNNEKIDCKIIDLIKYDDLDILTNNKDVTETKEEIRVFYSDEEIEKYGLLAIYIELV